MSSVAGKRLSCLPEEYVVLLRHNGHRNFALKLGHAELAESAGVGIDGKFRLAEHADTPSCSRQGVVADGFSKESVPKLVDAESLDHWLATNGSQLRRQQ